VPFLWTIFFFVLALNLFGMIPWMGSPTGSLAVTSTLALITFFVVIGAGMQKLGTFGMIKSLVPHMDLPFPIKIFLVPFIFCIELFGLLVKHGVLAVRLLANMMAGHVVLAVILAFIAAGAQSIAVSLIVTPASVLGATALSMLELFVAFLQAYIFTFLSALFIGMAVHPH
jgi:F-type H+-transporting ATPase subunit a